MRWLVGIPGALIGMFIGLDLPERIFRLFVPSRGCMSGFDFLPLLPLIPFTMALGGFLGAYGANKLLTRFWEWQTSRPDPPRRHRRKRRKSRLGD
jgi:hypothetical protein